MTVNPQTYGDLAEGGLPVPHGVGSVWATTLWDMHWNIVNGIPVNNLPGYGFRQNLYDMTPPLAGNQVALRIVMDGLKMQPCNPTFLDARDAILAADLADYAGAHECHIWRAFARRGMGINALDGGGTLDVAEGFALPPQCVQGACAAPPVFAGLASLSAPTDPGCRLDLSWSPAVDSCETGRVTYSVYRSTSPGFLPGPANLLASGLEGTTFQDTTVTSGVEYSYIVQATDALGNSDNNRVRRREIPLGSLTSGGTFRDDAGDTFPLGFNPGMALGSWVQRATGGATAPKAFASTATGNYADASCYTLESDTLYLGGNPTLTFKTKYDIEPGWDGGIVEVATQAGGYSDWTKLASITYPGVRVAAQTVTGCNSPGLRVGETMFTGTTGGQYIDVSGSLSAYANQAVRLRFVLGSDDATNDLGWLVDDVVVSDVRSPGPCTTPPTSDSGMVENSLTVARAGPQDIMLSWSASCNAGDTDYEVQEGTVGSFYSHAPRFCSTGGLTTRTFAPGDGSRYYLIVPRNAAREGSYGRASSGVERPQGGPMCVAQQSAACP